MTDEMEKIVLSYVQSRAVDEAAEYLQRGRRYKNLTDDQLKEIWIKVSKAFFSNPSDGELKDQQSDLDGEFKVRNIDVPFESVKEEFEEFTSRLSAAFEELKRDPAKLNEANADFTDKLTHFLSEKERSN